MKLESFNTNLPENIQKASNEFVELIENKEKIDFYHKWQSFTESLDNGSLEAKLANLYKNNDVDGILKYYDKLKEMPLVIADFIYNEVEGLSESGFDLSDEDFNEAISENIKDLFPYFKKLEDVLGSNELLETLPAIISLSGKEIRNKLDYFGSCYYGRLSEEDQLNYKHFDPDNLPQETKDSNIRRRNSPSNSITKDIYFQQISNDLVGNLNNGVLEIYKPTNAELTEIKNKFELSSKERQILINKIKNKFKPVSGIDISVSDKNKVGSEKVTEDYLNILGAEEILENYLKIDITEKLNFNEIYFLWQYVSCNTERQFEVVSNIANKYGNIGPFWKTFLSIEHGGNEMGDKILHLSENLPENEAKEIFNGYGNLIDNTNILGSKLSKHIEDAKEKWNIPNGVDIGKLPNELMNALMLRAKDVLVGADKVLENQLAGAEEKLNTKDVTDAVLGINTLVSMLSNIGEQSDYVYKKIDSIGNKPGETLTKYIVTDACGIEYALKIFIRPKAEKDAQARVNIELSFDTEKPNERLQKAFYNETINHKENKTSAGSVLRIGIDRDDFNYTGAVSLDLGRSERNTERYSRTGDVLGKLLSMTSTEGHHETSAFSKEFADEKVFESVTTMLAGYFANQETS